MNAAGFVEAKRPAYYVEDSSKNGWSRKATIFFTNGHLILQGVAGTGKDIWIEAYSSAFNRPLKRFAFRAGLNPSDWVQRMDLKADENGTNTVPEDGDLLKACRGIIVTRDFSGMPSEELQEVIRELESIDYIVENNDGVLKINIPSVCLFSDYDRADSEQLEVLRQALEMGKGKLTNPITGELFDIHPGTRFFFTSNSGVDGDGGRGNITKRKDSSLLSRTRAIYTPEPTEKFETEVIMTKFPELLEAEAKLLVKCTRSVREVAKQQRMGLEITLRQTIAWAEDTILIRDIDGMEWKEAMKYSFSTITGHLGEEYNRDALQGAIDPHLKSNVIDELSQSSTTCPIDL